MMQQLIDLVVTNAVSQGYWSHEQAQAWRKWAEDREQIELTWWLAVVLWGMTLQDSTLLEDMTIPFLTA
jgi:hypothetical protein